MYSFIYVWDVGLYNLYWTIIKSTCFEKPFCLSCRFSGDSEKGVGEECAVSCAGTCNRSARSWTPEHVFLAQFLIPWKGTSKSGLKDQKTPIICALWPNHSECYKVLFWRMKRDNNITKCVVFESYSLFENVFRILLFFILNLKYFLFKPQRTQRLYYF